MNDSTTADTAVLYRCDYKFIKITEASSVSPLKYKYGEWWDIWHWEGARHRRRPDKNDNRPNTKRSVTKLYLRLYLRQLNLRQLYLRRLNKSHNEGRHADLEFQFQSRTLDTRHENADYLFDTAIPHNSSTILFQQLYSHLQFQIYQHTTKLLFILSKTLVTIVQLPVIQYAKPVLSGSVLDMNYDFITAQVSCKP